MNSNILIAFLLILEIINIYNVQSCSNYKRESRIKLDKNGYTNIIIGIEDGVVENKHLIDTIKTVFTEASEFLFNITKKRVYFKEIIILIPSTWKLDHDFNVNSYDGRLPNTTWESYDRADFCVEERDDFTIDTPFVVNFASNCGDQASHIKLSPDYFSQKNKVNKLYGPYANVLIHQWAQFRYGVFNEYPHKIIENNEEFYINSIGQIEATRCSLNMTGSLKDPSASNEKCEKFSNNGLPSSDCIFEDDYKKNDPNLKIGSLMYRYFLNQLNEFCDNDTKTPETLHNKIAPTIQNKECNGQSIWEVLRSHQDFRDFNNMPNHQIKSTIPKFYLLKHRFKKVVLLIDKSILLSNMFNNVVKALNDYIKLMLNDNDMIGVIHFENNAKITLGMTVIRDGSIRNKILDSAIPTSSKGKKSNIWNALSLALALLRTTLDNNDKISPSGGNIILITNSIADENYPNRDLVIDQLKYNEINLNLVRIGNDQDDLLENLIRESNGLSFLLKESNRLLEIDDSLISISNFETKNSNEVVELVNNFFEVKSNTNRIGHIFIDESISTKINTYFKIKFNIEKVKDYIEIIVFEPSSRKHQSKYNVKCKDSSLFAQENLNEHQEIICEFKKPKFGKWMYEIINQYDQNIYVHLKSNIFFHQMDDDSSYYSNYYDRDDNKKKRIKKQTLHNVQSNIKIDARWQRDVVNYPQRQIIYASLSRGLKPILNASVKAIIYRPSGDYISLELNDNGLGADRFKNDGIYTRYFSNFITDGLYYARVDVKTNHNSRVNMQKLVGSPNFEHYPSIGVVNKINLEYHLVAIEEISRTTSIGSFVLKDFNNDDLIAPSEIKDLYIDKIETANKYVKFTFTSPGDDGDLGVASEYQIICSYDINDLLDEKHDNQNKSLPIYIISSSFDRSVLNKPNQAGFSEYFLLNTSSYEGKAFSLKMRAVDASGNCGKWTWPLTIKLTDEIELSPQLRHYSSIESSLSLLNEKKKNENSKEKRFSKFFIGFIIGLSCILFVHIVLLAVLFIYKLKEWKSKKNDIKPIRV